MSWWDWPLRALTWLTTFLQFYDTVCWVIWSAILFPKWRRIVLSGTLLYHTIFWSCIFRSCICSCIFSSSYHNHIITKRGSLQHKPTSYKTITVPAFSDLWSILVLYFLVLHFQSIRHDINVLQITAVHLYRYISLIMQSVHLYSAQTSDKSNLGADQLKLIKCCKQSVNHCSGVSLYYTCISIYDL